MFTHCKLDCPPGVHVQAAWKIYRQNDGKVFVLSEFYSQANG